MIYQLALFFSGMIVGCGCLLTMWWCILSKPNTFKQWLRGVASDPSARRIILEVINEKESQ